MLPTNDVVVAGVRSPVYEAGDRNRKDAVVFVHGNPGPSDDWEDLAPKAAELTRVVAMDMPGYGRADRPKDFDYTNQGYARHLGGVLDAVGVERAHFVLHDFGGGWGLGWAADHRERLASVTLINTGVLAGYKWHKFAKIWQTPLLGELFQLTGNASMMHRAINMDNPKPVPREFVDRIFSYADWGHKSAVLKLYRASRDPEKTFMPIANRLKGVDVPTCVIWGAGDKYLPVEFAHKQKDYFPRAEVHVIEGAGHWPFIDEPEKVAAIVLPFLKRVTS